MSQRQTTNWVRENLPQLESRGPDAVSKIIEQAISDTRVARFWTVLLVILIPAVLVNVFHAELTALTGEALSRGTMLAISVIVTAVAAFRWSANILHRRIDVLATSGTDIPES